MTLRRFTGKREANGGPCSEEGNKQGEIVASQVQHLPRFPDNQERIKRNTLRKPERNRQRNRKRCRRNCKPGPMENYATRCRARPFPLQCREQYAAGAKAEKCNRNDHVGEVVPLANGKCAHQYDLVGQHRRGYQQKRYFTAPDAEQEATNLIRQATQIYCRLSLRRPPSNATGPRCPCFSF